MKDLDDPTVSHDQRWALVERPAASMGRSAIRVRTRASNLGLEINGYSRLVRGPRHAAPPPLDAQSCHMHAKSFQDVIGIAKGVFSAPALRHALGCLR
jgi:hypothetical protein